MKITQALRDWALIIAIAAGITGYLLFDAIDPYPQIRALAGSAVSVLQPLLIFCMLFLTFCRIDPRHIHLCRWHLWLLLAQGGTFAAIAAVLACMPHSSLSVILEGAMICLICPTATAAAVITRRLGGSLTQVTTYTILINILVSLLVPLLLPAVHPNPEMGSIDASLLIMGKVFPLLLMPLVLALLVRKAAPALQRRLEKLTDVSFYLWILALALAMAVTTRSVCHSTVGVATEVWLGVVSAACCLMQFGAGRWIGAHYGNCEKITAGQALGQKNTVVAIWMGYTFFTPVTALAGGFYSIWHNLVNSEQLYKAKHRK